jgi:hypothetical protein
MAKTMLKDGTRARAIVGELDVAVRQVARELTAEIDTAADAPDLIMDAMCRRYGGRADVLARLTVRRELLDREAVRREHEA